VRRHRHQIHYLLT